ncbi:MAG: DUF1015 domain-containing protein [Chloroflexi bacterium]|nr:DUF1015 domain-containing protein [Chloroflexota bacterium]
MADVQPLEAIRYAPDVDLARVVCPPFDTIAPKAQRRLYGRSPHSAVRLELPKGRDPYKAAAKTLRQWLNKGTLVRDETPAFYAYQQEFAHGGESYRRRLLFGRLRLEPWDSGTVLPHERTFPAPKEDRLKLLRSLRLNTSPIFLVYPDSQQRVAPLVARAAGVEPTVQFSDEDGSAHSLWRIDDPHVVATISRGLQSEKLYVADGHHRYETALAYSEERQAGDGRESFVLVALAAADDPGLLVLPIHRLVDVDLPVENALELLDTLFEVESRPSLADLLRDMADRGRMVNSFGLVAADSPDFYLLTLLDPEAAEPYLPRERSPAWRRLDAAIATNVILRHTLGLNDVQLEDIRTVWYGEDAERAVAEVRQGRARYAVLLNPISPQRVMAIADGGERMPPKSTFFYPKIPTGLLFHPLFGP